MHQMHITTKDARSSGGKKLVVKWGKPCTAECHEIEPNPSKDKDMHEGDNSSF
jgi:hypothetical protein